MSVRERLPESPRIGARRDGDEPLLRVALPPAADGSTRATIERLVDVAEALARRCAQLQEALDSRVVIEQAKGVLAERLQISPDEAFVILRQSARSSRTRIHDLAAEVVASRTNPAAIEQYV